MQACMHAWEVMAAAAHLEPDAGHGLEEGRQHAQEVDGCQRDAVAHLVQQPRDDGYPDEAECRDHIRDGRHHMIRSPLVLQLQPRGSQVELQEAGRMSTAVQRRCHS